MTETNSEPDSTEIKKMRQEDRILPFIAFYILFFLLGFIASIFFTLLLAIMILHLILISVWIKDDAYENDLVITQLSKEIEELRELLTK